MTVKAAQLFMITTVNSKALMLISLLPSVLKRNFFVLGIREVGHSKCQRKPMFWSSLPCYQCRHQSSRLPSVPIWSVTVDDNMISDFGWSVWHKNSISVCISLLTVKWFFALVEFLCHFCSHKVKMCNIFSYLRMCFFFITLMAFRCKKTDDSSPIRMLLFCFTANTPKQYMWVIRW